MRRAWVEPERLSEGVAGQALELPPETAHHLLRVLRLSPGERVELFDGAGRVASGVLDERGGVLLGEVRLADVPLPPLLVAQALVRGPKLEEVVRRATELGASELLVFQAARSQAPSVRLDRMERIAQQAARQSERAFVPALTGPSTFVELLARVGDFAGVVVVGWVGAERPLSHLLEDERERFAAGGMLIVIGPEGGLSADEQQQLAAAGGLPASLGAHVLRTETAALAALACAQVAASAL